MTKGITVLLVDLMIVAFERMVRHAEIGAGAVVALRYEATEFMSGATEVVAYGTAVQLGPPSN